MPAFADANASAAVSVIGRVIGIFAALEHRLPRSPFSRRFFSSSIAVLKIDVAHYITLATAARLCASATQIVAVHDRFATAIATAKPIYLRAAIASMPSLMKSYNGQTTKSLSCDIFKGGHSDLLRVAASSGGSAL
jgi:hypothetical protein